MKIAITALFVLLLPLACIGQPLRIVTIDSAGGASAMARDSQGVIYFAEQDRIRKGTPTQTTWVGQNDFFDITAMVVAPNGDIYYVVNSDNTVRKMSPSGVVTLVAGHAGEEGFANGRGANALFDGPTGIAMDSTGNLFVTEEGNDTVRKVRLTGDVTTFVPSDRLFFPQGLAIDSKNNLYVLDTGFNRLRKVTAAGAVTTLASLIDPGDDDAYLPSSVAVDNAGNIYVADTVKSTIKRISPSGAVETVAGVMYSEGASDGVGSAARFFNIRAILAEPDGSLLIADGGRFRRGLLTVPLETILPVVNITSPTSGQRWSNAVFTARGTASDNQRVTNLWYQLNGNPWTPAGTTNNWTNWTATLTGLIPGTNGLRTYAADASGNRSLTNTVSFVYVLSDRLTVSMTGRGTLTPNYSNLVLEINRAYAMTANLITGSGYTFTHWSDGMGNALTNGRTLQFNMISNLTLIANFADTNRPVVTITSPTPSQRWSNAVFTARGTTSDNQRVTNLWYQLNANAWALAITTNNWTNWTASLSGLIPGTNVVQAYAQDVAGNRSITNSMNLIYVLSDRLTVSMTGRGTLTPNYSNLVLEINRAYAMTANLITGSGYTFTHWSDGMGNALTNGRTLQFNMISNLTLIANFADTNRPTVAIISPTANQRWSNSVFTARGTTSDNQSVTNVWYQLNANAWALANTTNNWTNWTATLTGLIPGTNGLRTYAADASGNRSLTNTLSLVYVLSDRLTVAMMGRGTLTPNYSNAVLEINKAYSMTANPITGSGYTFTRWSDGMGNVLTNGRPLQFIMTSNLTLIANFVDTNRPVVTITSPTANQRLSNAVITARGTASDNDRISAVWFQLNGSPWILTASTNGWTNWTATVALVQGTNMIRAFAVDPAANTSLSNSMTFVTSNGFTMSLVFDLSQPPSVSGLDLSLDVSRWITGRIQVSTDLIHWATLTNFVSTNPPLRFRDAAATTQVQRFYRAVTP